MQINTVIFIVLAFLLSLSVAYFQYYIKVKSRPKIHLILFVLKSLALFLMLLLFINPTIKNKTLQNIKPVLAVLADNSKSISFFKETTNLQDFIMKLEEDKELNTKFDIQKISFGETINTNDSLSFSENNSNIANSISKLNAINKEKTAPIVLLTDGNQTIGNDYEFINSKQEIYPVVFGDTIKYKDLKINQLNVNKYSYIKNKFPVEVLLNYEGEANVTSQFVIYKNGKVVFRKKVAFSKTNNSKAILTNLVSTTEGLQYYTASIRKIDGEKNTKNNRKSFSIEVINEQTKVLILTSVIHPDIGALKKAIESNKQRAVDVIRIDKFKNQINDYQLVILFQPNNSFNSILNTIKAKGINYLLVSGSNANWNLLNSKQLGFSKKAINQTENYSAIYNAGFLTFLQKDIGFSQFAPLKDKFGEVAVNKEHQTLLYQSIKGVETKQPLLFTIQENNQKMGVLLGEGIWKWRANSFLNTNSFQDFDNFIGNLVQYLASNKKRNRLEVKAESLYPANANLKIAAFYTDENYKFDARANLEITITNIETKKVSKYPFSLINNAYQVNIEELTSGEYSYKVAVSGQNINKYGKFKITDFLIEEQFTNANLTKLQNLANNANGKLFYNTQFEDLKNSLLQNKSYYTTQKSIFKEENLIDWKWILFIVVSLLSTEWFIRKYHGKI